MKFKGGWIGKVLRINLTNGLISKYDLDKELALNYIGGRGFAVKTLWSEVKGIDPLSPINKLIIATGPLTGLFIPSSGKVVVATKSPLTGGYADGNIGSTISVNLKMSGYDMIIIEGRAKKPSYIYIDPDVVRIFGANDLWGKGAIETDVILKDRHGLESGTLVIGPGGENLVKYAVVISEFGRAGGRPGIGAVMGSKNLKAIVVRGWKDIPVANPDILNKLMIESIEVIKSNKNYEKWITYGTMSTIEWSQENSVLPAYNFSEGVFDKYKEISGETMSKEYKVFRKGCFSCPMPCGNISRNKKGLYKGVWAELDYENVGMLGSNLGIGNMNAVIKLNYLVDDMGLDAISTGSVLAFTIEAYKRGIISEKDLNGLKPEWGEYETVEKLIRMIAHREGFGNAMADGVKRAAEIINKGSSEFAIHVKGLEISAYDCHAAPGMALAYGTSPIGAHHKDAWFISWEIKMGREIISKEKVEKLIDMQRIRGGLFESFTVCRLPWIELDFPLDYYPKFLKAATGINFSINQLYFIADRIYNLMRVYWIREFKEWSRAFDYPPEKWFSKPLTKGPFKGKKLDKKAYDKLLDYYYELRGWDNNGIPKKSTLKRYGLEFVINELETKGIKLN